METNEYKIQEFKFEKGQYKALIKAVILKDKQERTVYRINLIKPFHAYICYALSKNEQTLSITYQRKYSSHFTIKPAFKFPYLDSSHKDHSILENNFYELFNLMHQATHQKFKNKTPTYQGDNIIIKKDKAYIDLIPEGIYPGLLIRLMIDQNTGDIQMKSWDKNQKTKIGKFLEHKTQRWVTHGKITNIKNEKLFKQVFDPKTQENNSLIEEIVDEFYPIFFEYGNDLLHDPIITDENTKDEPIKWIKGSKEELIEKIQNFFYTDEYYSSLKYWPLSIIIGYTNFTDNILDIIVETHPITKELEKFIEKITPKFKYEGYRLLKKHPYPIRKSGYYKAPQIIHIKLEKPNSHQKIDAYIKMKRS